MERSTKLNEMLKECFVDADTIELWMNGYSRYLNAVPNELVKQGKEDDVIRALIAFASGVYI